MIKQKSETCCLGTRKRPSSSPKLCHFAIPTTQGMTGGMAEQQKARSQFVLIGIAMPKAIT